MTRYTVVSFGSAPGTRTAFRSLDAAKARANQIRNERNVQARVVELPVGMPASRADISDATLRVVWSA